jgi:hypothetical protein
VFFEGISDLFLVIHDLLLFVLDEDPAVDTQDEGRSVELLIIVVFGVGVLGGQGLALVLGAEL